MSQESATDARIRDQDREGQQGEEPIEARIESALGASWRVGAPIVLASIGVWALIRAWPFGPDLQVDFGRELYLPWRVSQGDRLYLDVAHWGGPLSVTWHAILFEVFGASLAAVKASNAMVCAAIAAAVYTMADRLAGAVAGFVTTAFFVAALAFAQALPLANYDYLTPYAHELTHGIALSLVGLAILVTGADRAGEKRRTGWWCGGLLAAVAATKVEVTVAYAVALAVAYGLPLLRGASAAPEVRAWALRDLGRLGGGFGAGVVAITAVVALQSGLEVAWLGWLEPWRIVFETNVSSLAFYRHTMGTYDVPASLMRIFWGGASVTAGCVVIATVSIACRRFAPRWALYGVLLVWLLLGWAFPMTPGGMRLLLAPVGAITLLLFVGSLREALRSGGSEAAARASVLAFAVALTAKMALNAKLSHYGFALYMPATLVCIAALIGPFPKAVARRGGSIDAAIVSGIVFVAALGLGMHTQTERHRGIRTAEVGAGPDAMRADYRAHAFNRALDYLHGLPRDSTVAVLPEGVMLNYLARREAPTRFVNFMPPEFEIYGESAIVDAFRASPPDVVVYVHKRAGLYGLPDFGRDFGGALREFVEANYRPVETWGDPPFEATTRFGVRVLERRAGP